MCYECVCIVSRAGEECPVLLCEISWVFWVTPVYSLLLLDESTWVSARRVRAEGIISCVEAEKFAFIEAE